MSTTDSSGAVPPSLWTNWAEASAEQRAHFKTLPQHKAWARTCRSCGQGDFLERKNIPVLMDARLHGRGFPVLPAPGEDPNAKRSRRQFRTPVGRVHTCEPFTGATAAG